MIKASKALAQEYSANTKNGWKKIPSMYKKMLFEMNPENGETPVKKISNQGIEIFDKSYDTEAHSLLDLGLKHQGL